MSTPQHKFKETVLALLAKFPHWKNQLEASGVSGLPSNEVLSMGVSVLQGYQDIKLLEMFVNKTHPCWGKIKNRDISFFLEDLGTVTSLIPQGLVTGVFTAKNTSGDLVINQRAQGFIWDCLAVMTKFSLDFIIANPSHFPQIDNLSELRKTWNR